MLIWGALRYLMRAAVVVLAVIAVSWPLFWPREDARGVWQTEGYGMVLDVGRFRIDGYQVNAAGCVPFITAPAHSWLLAEIADTQMDVVNARLTLTVEGTINTIGADRIDRLPAACLPQPDISPQAVFDVAHATMDEHYPFFDLHGVSWTSHYTTLPDNADDAALWAALTTSLAGLDDGHLFLYRPDTQAVFSPATRPDWAADVMQLRDTLRARGLTAVEDTGLEYAILPDNIGYVFLRHMGTNPGLFTTEAALATAAFSDLSDSLLNTRAIILDNRLNPGGSDTVALAYASFFTDQPVPAFSKTTRTASGYTAPVDGVVAPIGSLTQPVYLLNSSFTASAAEIFAMAMQEMPQVTVIGEPTAGGLSDVLEWTLPNGWVLGLPHQVYRDATGDILENIGITPDMDRPFDASAMRLGVDAVLDEAITLAGNN